MPPTQLQHAKEGKSAPAEPYPMNYTDQMAQSLGVRDGKWEAFTSKPPPDAQPECQHGQQRFHAQAAMAALNSRLPQLLPF